jgi:hypothetical protein
VRRYDLVEALIAVRRFISTGTAQFDLGGRTFSCIISDVTLPGRLHAPALRS